MFMGILSIIIGYLLGSISPSYFLGKLLKGIDIRKHGDGNAGGSNTYHVLGFWPAVVTVIYDLFKGLLAFFIAKAMGANELFWYLAGIFAIIGHIFPFYLNFKGGQGAAASTGLLLYFLFQLFYHQYLPVESLLILVFVIVCTYIITRKKEFLALIIMPSLIFLLLKNYQLDLMVLFTSIICAFLFALNIYESYRKKLFELKPNTLEHVIVWRTLMRPLGFLIPLGLFYLEKNVVLWVIGIVTLIPLLIDLIRLASTKINIFFFDKIKKIYKKREKKRFSSITLFLLSTFLVILFFDKSIAIVSITYLIFGDLFAKFFGLEYGKIKLFADKTLEGSVGHFMVCLLAGYLLWPYVGLPFGLIFSAAIIATIAEAVPVGINDNFLVSISTAFFMQLTRGWF